MERKNRWQTPGALPEKQAFIVACFALLTVVKGSDCSVKNVPSCMPVIAVSHLGLSYTVAHLLAA